MGSQARPPAQHAGKLGSLREEKASAWLASLSLEEPCASTTVESSSSAFRGQDIAELHKMLLFSFLYSLAKTFLARALLPRKEQAAGGGRSAWSLLGLSLPPCLPFDLGTRPTWGGVYGPRSTLLGGYTGENACSMGGRANSGYSSQLSAIQTQCHMERM